MMTILLTGATGLVGARLLPRLIEAGEDCRVLVRSVAEVPAGAAAVRGDLMDPSCLAEAVAGVSAIIHLAAVFRTPDTDLIWRVNLDGTRNLIAAAEAHAPGARFIMASTSNVYGVGTKQSRPGREDEVTEPKQAYPASKLAAEKFLRESGLNWVIQRFSFVYGDEDGHLESLPRLATQFKLHPAVRMSMVHHRDIAAAMKLALSGAMDRQVVNITDEAPTSLYELAELVGEPMSPSAEPLESPWNLHVDGSLARRLGFKPSVRTVYQAVEERLM